MSGFRAGSLDWARGERVWDLNPCFDKHFMYGCAVCHRGPVTSTQLTRCSSCRIVYYCSQACQKRHWKNHKAACATIKHMHEELPSCPAVDERSWKQYISEGRLYLSYDLGTSDSFYLVSHPWLRQRHCQVCFYCPAAPQRGCENRRLKECVNCNDAACCDDVECLAVFKRIHDAEACEKYLIGLASVVMSMQQGTLLGIPSNSRDSIESKKLADWNTYFTYKIQDFSSDVHPQLLRHPPVLAMVTDALQIMMTIINCLQRTVPDLLSMTHLCIHVVGAEGFEIMSLPRYEEILHWLPALQSLGKCRMILYIRINSFMRHLTNT